MPAKENVLLLSESANQTILIRKDVDNLVQNIKENLKLTQYEAGGLQCTGLGSLPTSLPDFSDYPTAVSDSGPLKSRSFVGSRTSRASPYGLVVAKNAKCECIETAGGGPAAVPQHVGEREAEGGGAGRPAGNAARTDQ